MRMFDHECMDPLMLLCVGINPLKWNTHTHKQMKENKTKNIINGAFESISHKELINSN